LFCFHKCSVGPNCKKQNVVIGWPALTRNLFFLWLPDIVLTSFFTVWFLLIDSSAMFIKYLLTYLLTYSLRCSMLYAPLLLNDSSNTHQSWFFLLHPATQPTTCFPLLVCLHRTTLPVNQSNIVCTTAVQQCHRLEKWDTLQYESSGCNIFSLAIYFVL